MKRHSSEKINTAREQRKDRSERETSRLHRGLGITSLVMATSITAGISPTANTAMEHRAPKPPSTALEADPGLQDRLDAELGTAYNHPWVWQVENTHRTIEGEDGKRAIINIHVKDAAKNTEADHPHVTYDDKPIDKAVSMETPNGTTKLFSGGIAVWKSTPENGEGEIEARIRQANFKGSERITVKYEFALGAQARQGGLVRYARVPFGILSVSGDHNKIRSVDFSAPSDDEIIITNESNE
jgi:hypothetical protein